MNTSVLNSVLGADIMAAMNIEDIGEQIQAGIGVDVDDVHSSEATLVTMMPDDSSSIRFVAGNAQAVRDGHNGVLDAFKDVRSAQRDGLLIHCRYLNGGVLYPFSLLEKTVRMDTRNYDPNLGTPLYDQSVVVLSTVLTKAKSFEDSGVPCRTITLLGPTDGRDEHSRTHTVDEVFKMVQQMLLMENHIIAGMGIDDGSTDFYEIYSGWTKQEIEKARKDGSLDSLVAKGGMGVQPRWVMTSRSDPKEIRRCMALFSQSAIRASQSSGSFSQTSAGGFAN